METANGRYLAKTIYAAPIIKSQSSQSAIDAASDYTTLPAAVGGGFLLSSHNIPVASGLQIRNCARLVENLRLEVTGAAHTVI